MGLIHSSFSRGVRWKPRLLGFFFLKGAADSYKFPSKQMCKLKIVFIFIHLKVFSNFLVISSY